LREAAHWAAEKCRTVTNRETKVKERICGDKSKGYCLAGVKDALLKAGFTSTRIGPTIAFARDMHKKETLKDEGFKDIMPEGFTSETAPEGAILVYSGGIRTGCPKGGCGHIEIKLGPKEYCSDFCSTRPVDA